MGPFPEMAVSVLLAHSTTLGALEEEWGEAERCRQPIGAWCLLSGASGLAGDDLMLQQRVGPESPGESVAKAEREK